MPTRRSNRLRAAEAATAISATPDVAQIAPAFTSAPAAAEQVASPVAPAVLEQMAPAFTGAPTTAEVATVAVIVAASSRRARRQAASGTPVAQPMTGPAEVVVRPAEPAAVAATTVVPKPVVPARPIFEEAAPAPVEAEPVEAEPVVRTEPVIATEPVAPVAEPAARVSEPATPEASKAQPEPHAPDFDVFAMASDAFGFAVVDDSTDVADDTAVPEATEVPVADEPVVDGAAPAHIAPRRPRRMLRRVVAAGASFGVMGVAGLIAVSMTLPVSAVAASQGADARTSASLVAADGDAGTKAGGDEIQAFVASSDVEGEALARSDSFETVSLSEVAAEEGIKFSESLYTNDPDAAIQWPFIVGVAMSSPYGTRWGRLHAGIDLVPGNGAPIQAIADGVVRTATESGGAYGVTVYIDHVIDGQKVTSHYAHMQHGSLQVQAGQKVKVGDIVGKVGNTGRSYGAHLHFEIIINGATVDPLPWMRKNAGRYSY
ncbi:M23 family metallopeptidase [Microbacterium sp. H1-D42]|uniref:M23 family metallopeptidase n=1 Tax=Microbacterium sp. H1-D42 TaxID=2925844 RepID=UPI001F52FB80|nr:M23 family metallopeptidase [Microbacterium sp. H1-D42]UNK70163.1 peptidoglycan DD-metalloendopeptidase family protein [Microbacterium sp. H1-D42]